MLHLLDEKFEQTSIFRSITIVLLLLLWNDGERKKHETELKHKC